MEPIQPSETVQLLEVCQKLQEQCLCCRQLGGYCPKHAYVLGDKNTSNQDSSLVIVSLPEVRQAPDTPGIT